MAAGLRRDRAQDFNLRRFGRVDNPVFLDHVRNLGEIEYRRVAALAAGCAVGTKEHAPKGGRAKD